MLFLLNQVQKLLRTYRTTKEEFVQLIQEEKWNELFTEVPC